MTGPNTPEFCPQCGDRHCSPCPSPEEIAAACLLIQATWTDGEQDRRAWGTRGQGTPSTPERADIGRVEIPQWAYYRGNGRRPPKRTGHGG